MNLTNHNIIAFVLSKAQIRDYHTGKIVANGSIYGLEHYLADDPSSSSTTWKQTLEAISPRATCACISLRDMQACLGEDFLPVLIKRSRAYFYNLERASTITKNLDDISASHAPQSTEPTKLSVNISLYQALRGRLLANRSIAFDSGQNTGTCEMDATQNIHCMLFEE